MVQTGAAFQPVGDMFNPPRRIFDQYDYNTRSELVDAVRYFGSSTNDTSDPVGLQDWSYAYDNIGNRTGTTKANAAANYTANALNQYTERSVPDSSDIIGCVDLLEVRGLGLVADGFYECADAEVPCPAQEAFG